MYLLDDQDIDEDLRTIYKARNPLTTKNLTSSPSECVCLCVCLHTSILHHFDLVLIMLHHYSPLPVVLARTIIPQLLSRENITISGLNHLV